MYPTCENVDLALKRAEAIVENLITGEAQVHAREAIGILAATIKRPIPELSQEELKAQVPARISDLDPYHALLVLRSILPELVTASVLAKVSSSGEAEILSRLSALLGRVYGLTSAELAKMGVVGLIRNL